MDIDDAMIDRATNAIKECMLNRAWLLRNIRREVADAYVREAAEAALRWALNPEQAFHCGDSVAEPPLRKAR